jgi:hypothetical protein
MSKEELVSTFVAAVIFAAFVLIEMDCHVASLLAMTVGGARSGTQMLASFTHDNNGVMTGGSGR